MSTLKLDRNKPFAQVYGDLEGRHYEQDNRYFRGDGTLWVDPNAPKKKESAAEREAREKAEAEAEAARLEAEKKAAGGSDDQLSQQLGN